MMPRTDHTRTLPATTLSQNAGPALPPEPVAGRSRVRRRASGDRSVTSLLATAAPLFLTVAIYLALSLWSDRLRATRPLADSAGDLARRHPITAGRRARVTSPHGDLS